MTAAIPQTAIPQTANPELGRSSVAAGVTTTVHGHGHGPSGDDDPRLRSGCFGVVKLAAEPAGFCANHAVDCPRLRGLWLYRTPGWHPL